LWFRRFYGAIGKSIEQYVVYIPRRELTTLIFFAEIISVVKAAKNISRVAIIYMVDLNPIRF